MIFWPFGLLASKDCNYLAFKYVDYGVSDEGY